ncbi:hypothetical protein Taro_018724, partial [Colocasia esculenta]|nr:hypothetical protein [Colocasia esculenta]
MFSRVLRAIMLGGLLRAQLLASRQHFQLGRGRTRRQDPRGFAFEALQGRFQHGL